MSDLILVQENSTPETVELVSAGPQGPSGTFTIGTITTGLAGSSANVTNTGTPSQAVLNFTIPRGDVGDVTPEATAAKNAAQSASSAAATSQVVASNAATSATASASSAQQSATAAASSSSTATSKAAEASTSAASAESSEIVALGASSTATLKASEAGSFATAASTSAASSETSANASASYAAAASGSANASATSAGNASGSASLAQEWATKTISEVALGQGYGAKKYALDAASMAAAAEIAAAGSLVHSQTAAGHSQSASTSANNANTSASVSSDASVLATLRAGQAAESASTSSSQAANAAASAATATSQASSATASASTASTQAGIATTKASEASTSASAASVSAAAALASQTASAGSAAAANTSAGSAAGSASSALAIYGTTNAQQAALVAAQSAASLAQGFALSASSAIQQDLSGVTAQALHRSPNAVTAMFVYDTSKDSDGGAWTEKCQHTSWYNEALNGKWLGAQASEFSARNKGATLGTNLIVNGDLASNTTGWSATYGAISFENGRLRCTSMSAPAARATQAITCVIGKTYRVAADYFPGTDPAGLQVTVCLSAGSTTGNIGSTGGVTVAGTADILFVATQTTHYLALCASTPNTGTYVEFDNISVREVTALTTASGDYYQSTVDGKFYKLNPTSGVTETFRGNKADFPRLAGIVAESQSVTIYDLTEANRPMWLRFMYANSPDSGSTWFFSVANPSCVSALGGKVAFGTTGQANTTGLNVVDFPNDELLRYANNTARGGRNRAIANRLSTSNLLTNTTPALANGSGGVNAVAMTILPDAPVDIVSGLQVPTIAVATAGGVSVIRHSGVVRNSADTVAFNNIAFYQGMLYWSASATEVLNSRRITSDLPASFTADQFYRRDIGEVGTFFPRVGNNAGTNHLRPNSKGVVIGNTTPPLVHLLVQGIKIVDTQSRGVVAKVSNTYNTGHMTGDIRRAYLADVGAGSVTAGPELVTNGDFSSGTTGWTTGFGSTSSTFTSASGVATLTQGGADTSPRAKTTLSGLVVGSYLSISVEIKGSSGIGDKIIILATGADGTGGPSLNLGPSPAAGVRTWMVSATAATMYLGVNINNSGAGASFSVDNISVRECVADRSYKAQGASITGTLTKTEVATAAQLVAYSGFSASNYLREPYSADLNFGTGEWSVGGWVRVPTANAAAATIACREHSSGAYVRFGIGATNNFIATAFDGTTTRTVTTTAAYNTNTWLKAEADYTTDGTLSISVNGVEVAATRGNPLLTLNNSNAVLTIGNSFNLDAPFPGSIALLKLSATVPTPEQSVWMYEQEKQLFRDGANCVLPDSGSIVDLTYDDATDKWIAVSATNESEWSGLVRTSVTPVPAGSYTRAVANSGVQMLARSTTNPGVDITIPSYGLREELVRRSESAARLARTITVLDYAGGFTANTTLDTASVTGVAGLLYPASYIGARVTGANIQADTFVVGIVGTTMYLTKTATSTVANAQLSFSDFVLPLGYEAKVVSLSGAAQREGLTQQFVRLFDGFKETIRFGTSPAYNAPVQIQAVRSAA